MPLFVLVKSSEITITASRHELFAEKADCMDISKDESDEREDEYDDMIACSPAGSNSESPPPKVQKPSLEIDVIQKLYSRQGRENPGNERILSSLAVNQCLPGDSKLKSFVACDSNMDDDISQYELDSFKSMISASAFNVATNQHQFSPNAANYDLTKPVDKASVRQYCTQEANNLYRCTVCSKTYTHISNFCRHFLSAHHGIKQEVPCPVCLKLFTRRDNMVTHTKQVHRITLSRNSMQPISLENLDSSDNVSYS